MNYQDIKLALYRVETLAIDGLVTEAHALVEDIRGQGMAVMDYKHIVSAEARKLIREHGEAAATQDTGGHEDVV